MSDSLNSIEEITNLSSSRTIDSLLNENRIQNAALEKATNLIQLLQIELEVQKNSYKQSLKAMKDQYEDYYNQEIQHQRQKILSLEQKIAKYQEKRNNNRNLEQRRNEQLSHTRIKSFQSVSSISVNKNKRLSNTRVLQEQQQSKQVNKQLLYMTDTEFIRKVLFKNQDLYQSLMNELEEMVNLQNQQVISKNSHVDMLKGQIQELYTQVQVKQQTKQQKRIKQLQSIIYEQRVIINRMKQQQQELEEIVEGFRFRLDALTTEIQNMEWPSFNDIDPLKIVDFIRINNPILRLKAQNRQIKNILDNMIALVRQDLTK